MDTPALCAQDRPGPAPDAVPSRRVRRWVLAGVLALSAATPATARVLFSQNFQDAIDPISGAPILRCSGTGGAGTYPFPPGWLLRNVDNRTPDGATAYVNDAWEVREDFGDDSGNCVAFSNSWYRPAGSADDWMWTPFIGPVPAGDTTLRWRARSYDPDFRDSYEVRVMVFPNVPSGGTGVIGNQLSASVLEYAVAAEAVTWTSHSIDLSHYAGQGIYIGFRNDSNDKFLLVLDDVQVTNEQIDLAALPLQEFLVPYTQVPAGVAAAPALAFTAFNASEVDFTNVQAFAQLMLDGVPFGAPLSAAVVPTMTPFATTTMSFEPAPALTAPGAWSVEFSVVAAESADDDVPGNDQLSAELTVAGGDAWSRHTDAIQGVLGIGTGEEGELGTRFTLEQTATFSGIRFAMLSLPASTPPSAWPGQTLVARLRAARADGKPGALLAVTEPIISSLEGGVYSLRFEGGPQTLPPGTYFAGVVEPEGSPQAMPLVMSRARFEESSVWVYWPGIPGGDWRTLESFGEAFRYVPHVSLLALLPDPVFAHGFESGSAPASLQRATLPGSVSAESLRDSIPAWSLSDAIGD